MGYVVITPLVIAKDEAGSDVYAYQGQPVPGSVPASELKRLLDGEFIKKDAVEEEVPERAFPEGEPDESWTVKQLQAYAAEFEVDLGEASKKVDILKALE